MTRLEKGGLIDRSQGLKFKFDQRSYTGHPGDTLASALLAGGVKVMGRSFKYHRPRGVLSAGSEEPNALMEIGTGADRLPNTRATTQELYAGLTARSQNRWPSLRHDMMAVNDALSPFLAAGFYYKTFMWPKSFWEKIYEPIIRRAAGLGRLSGLPDPAIYDKAWAHCDLLIIGAGPAGLMAALQASEAGAQVILADEDFRFGGRLLSETGKVDDMHGADWVATVLARLQGMTNVTLMPRTTITGAYDGGTYGALERVADHLAEVPDNCPRQTFWRIVAKRAILCSGAIERPIAFPANDRPGIMLAGAVRSYVTRYGVTPGQKVAVYTNNDDGWKTAQDLSNAGVDVVALIDARRTVILPEGPWQNVAGGTVTNTSGRHGLTKITLRTEETTQNLSIDCLAVAGGWNPTLHLTSHMNARPEWHDDILAFVPKPGAVPGLNPAGAAAGILSTHGALKSGQEQARTALTELGVKRIHLLDLPRAEDEAINTSAFWHVMGKGRAWVDFQNDVTVKDLELAHRENFRSVEHMKRYTTLGMATDQGKTSNIGAMAVMAELAGTEIADIGTTTFRPPYTPIQIGALGARATGKGLAPERHLASHNFALTRRAPMIEAGLWQRAAYFPQEGETHWRDSCEREVKMVRNSVGICDVGSLGKIEVAGPDAARLLDLVYINNIETLPVGRIRYGFMLREDGFVMDDGTCTRLDETRFLISTTTGAAEQVMRHLEFCTQCLWPDLDVVLASVTEQWAQFAIAGPQSDVLLANALDGKFALQNHPFMRFRSAHMCNTDVRLFRISYSGEIGFEIAVPARQGEKVFGHLIETAQAMGCGPYGLEALNVLRIEKGFLTHAELNGRVSADDIGVAHLLTKKPDCIGLQMSRRPGLHGTTRNQLVGLQPVDRKTPISGGAYLINEHASPTRENAQGSITSACYSPTLQSHIALGFLKNGRARLGEQVVAVDFMRARPETLCTVVSPQFYDPKGEAMRG